MSLLLGVPRFGEPGAKGWCNYKSSEEQQGVRPAPLKPTGELLTDSLRSCTIISFFRYSSVATSSLVLRKLLKFKPDC